MADYSNNPLMMDLNEMTDFQKKQIAKRAAKAGMTVEEYVAKQNEPYVNTAKNIANNSLAGSNNMGQTESAAIDVDKTALPTAQTPEATETVNKAATEKLGSDTEGNAAPEIKALDADLNKKSLGSIEGNPVHTEETAVSKPTTKKQKTTRIKSILQAYADGDIDKSARDYLIADTLGTFARNLGKDIGNVAAAYSGGTASTERDKAMWESRPEALFQSGTEAEQAQVKGSDKYIERLKTIPAQRFMDDAAQYRAQGNATAARIMEMVGAASANGDQGPEEYLAAMYGSNPEFKSLIDNALKGAANATGALADILGFFTGK